MIKFVDIDGVVFDSQTHLFDEFNELFEKGAVKDAFEYVQIINWYKYLLNSEVINNSIEILKQMEDNIVFLSKVCSNEEAKAKKRILDEKNIKYPIVFVPFYRKKTDMVLTKGNILIDDSVKNLDEWAKEDGIPIYFNKDNLDIDYWKNINKKYPKTNSLEILYKYK